MIRLQHVTLAYERGTPVLEDVSLDVGRGLTLLVGPNGSGKSTLLKILAGVERPDRGCVAIDGFDLWRDEVASRQRLAYVPQNPDLTPYATIGDVMQLVCRLRAEPREAAVAALTRVGLSAYAGRSIRELSVGQQRRAVLAAAWIGSPHVLLLDEPLETMDAAIRGDILSWIDERIDRDAAAVVATHQIEPFAPRAARAIARREDRWEVIEPLPSALDLRIAMLHALSRGEMT